LKNLQNPYYYWYEFLRRSEPYRKCCESNGRGELSKLYKRFANVHRLTFEQWWQQVEVEGELFLLADDWYLHVIKNEEDFRAFDDEYGVTLTVNLFERDSKLIVAFRELLKEVRPTKNVPQKGVGRPKYEHHALTRFHSRPDTHSLQTTLRVYDAWKAEQAKPKEGRKTLYKIGVEAKASSTHIVKPRDSKDAAAQKRIKMAITVSRFARQAEAIIKNAEQGIFPKRTL
jgi:hypothetical protein